MLHGDGSSPSLPSPSTCLILAMPLPKHRPTSPHSSILHRRVVLMKQLRKKMFKMRQQVKVMKQLHLKDMAQVEEMERECAHWRRFNHLASQQNSSIIQMTLQIIDHAEKEDEHHHVKLMQSLREQLEAWNLNMWATLLTATGQE